MNSLVNISLWTFLVASAITMTLQCPQEPKCQCGMRNNRHYISCHDVHITSLIRKLPSYIHQLEIKRSNLRVLQSDVFGFISLPSIRVLAISNSGLRIIKDNAFVNFPNLEQLILRSNDINQVSSMAFKSLAQLTSLDLSRNKIQELNVDVFDSISTSLRDLSLSQNLLDKMVGIFQKLYKLELLNISDCGITTLEGIKFKNLNLLTSLDISYNKLHNISSNTLQTLRELSKFYLMGNQWHCDCGISSFKKWLEKSDNFQKLRCPIAKAKCKKPPKCSSPAALKGEEITSIEDDHIAKCVPWKDEDDNTSKIIIAVAVVFVILAIIVSVGLIIYVKRRNNNQNTTPKSENGSCKPINSTNHNGAFDMGSINESDRAFPLRNYMKTLDQLSGPFSSVHSDSCHTRQSDNGSLSLSGQMIEVQRIKRESAV